MIGDFGDLVIVTFFMKKLYSFPFVFLYNSILMSLLLAFQTLLFAGTFMDV